MIVDLNTVKKGQRWKLSYNGLSHKDVWMLVEILPTFSVADRQVHAVVLQTMHSLYAIGNEHCFGFASDSWIYELLKGQDKSD